MSSKKTPKKSRSTANHATRTGNELDLLGPLGLFSSNADQFALLTVAVDKHCLRIFDVLSSSLVAEHTVDAARVSSICWLTLALKEDETTSNRSTPARPKKRKKSALKTVSSESNQTELVGLGMTDGSLLLYSPKNARVLRVLSHSTLSCSVTAVAPGRKPMHLWCSTSNGSLHLWNVARNELLKSYKTDDAAYTSLALFPNEDEGEDEDLDLLAANHAIKLLSIPSSINLQLEDHKLKEKMALTGHISSVKNLDFDDSRLLSHAEGDRNLLANASLDSTVRQITTHSGKLLAISASDKVSLFELPAIVPDNQISTLIPSSTISREPKAENEDISVIAVTFIPDSDSESHVRIARLKGGARPIFEDVHYLENGKYIPQVFLLRDISILAATAQPTLGVTKQWYKENPHLIAGDGTEMPEGADDILAKEIDGDLDVDLAELSLGQRLTARSGADLDGRSSDSDNDKGDTSRNPKTSRSRKTKNDEGLAMPSQSLSRTLVQALHSADTRLLELCLRHSDESVILNTVKRLPPQLAVPLLMACVERLGRGARAGTARGGGAGASAQRGTGLVRWIRAVLIVHTAHLVTMPDLVTRLSGLHATITARLALRDPLLALSGRVDLILSQMELRSSGIISTVKPEKRKEGRKSKAPYRYVEGETESETEEKTEERMDVEEKDEDGSVEDVELGGESDGSEESGDEDSELDGDQGEDDEEDGDEEDGPRFNGFVDDEADEASSDENEL